MKSHCFTMEMKKETQCSFMKINKTWGWYEGGCGLPSVSSCRTSTGNLLLTTGTFFAFLFGSNLGCSIRDGDKTYEKLEFPGESGIRPNNKRVEGKRVAYRPVLSTQNSKPLNELRGDGDMGGRLPRYKLNRVMRCQFVWAALEPGPICMWQPDSHDIELLF